MLCELCQKVGLPHASYKKHKDDTGYHSHLCIYRHHKTYVDLVNSATLGCELCALFRPFIEHAQLREAGLVEVAESECSNTDYGSDVTRADPFLFEDEDNLSEEDYESEDGDDGFGEDSSDDKAEEIENASVRSQRSSNFQEDIENKTHEVLEWLFLITDDLTGPEQLWLIAESGGKEQDDQTKSSGSLTTLTLSAGSIDNVHLDFNDSEYCLDGRYIGSRQSLAVVVPGLWKWHRKWLNILAGRKRPLRSLRPIFEYFQHRDNLTDFDPPIEGRNVVEDIASKAGFGLLRQWHNACLFKHPGCPSLSLFSPPELPTRVIDVGPLELPPEPRLYTAKAADRNCRYAILSHCWGPDASNISKTCLTNLEVLHDRIDLSTLSRNFSDAIKIAHGMKIRFLWIDALCIIQDSPEDWARESAKMAQYYKNADITIAGLASPHASHGLLNPRYSDRNVARISTPCGEVFVRPQLYDTVSIVSNRSYSVDRPYVSYMPLNERAWTVQERVLSSRIIHFSEQQLVWQCKTCAVSEDGQYTEHSKTASKRKLVDLLDLKINRGPTHPEALISIIRTGWHDLLAEYTSPHLTYDSDKLPALSGLAHEVSKLTEDNYLAGLWVRRLREELLWRRLGDDDQRDGIVPSRIHNGSPTWSWASLKGKIRNEVVRYRRIPHEYDPRIVKTYSKLATSDPFGRVLSANVSISIMCHDYVGPTTFAKKSAHAAPSPPRSGSESSAEDNTSTYFPSEYQDETFATVRLDVNEPKCDFTATPHLIACFGEYNSDGGSTDPTWADPKNKHSHQEFMLLQRKGKVAGTVYCRVGVASMMDGTRRKLRIMEEEGWMRRTILIM